MKTEEFKDVLLQVLELQLEYQLRAIRQLRGKSETEPSLTHRRGRRRQSLVDLSIQILTEERSPSMSTILSNCSRKAFGRLTDRDALSSALAKKARRGILLRQSAPATFSLLDSKEA